MKKKTVVLLLALIMIFAFVSCNPEASDSSASSGSLPGEVTPPSEDERKSMSDADIKLAYTYFEYSIKDVEESSSMSLSLKVSSEKIGTITVKEESEGTNSKTTVNGNIKIGTDEYKVENLVFTQNSSSLPAIEKGSLSKNGETLANDKLLAALSLIGDYVEKHMEDFDTYEYNQRGSCKVKLEKDNVAVGSGIMSGSIRVTQDSESAIQVYDITVNGVRLQTKAHSDGEGVIFDYIALDGNFFDKESIRKLLALTE